MRIRLIASMFLLACILVLPLSAQAQADGLQFGFIPAPTKDPSVTEKGYFVYRVEAGAQVAGQVLLQNDSSQPLMIQLAAVDAATAQNGGSVFADVAAAPAAVAKWLRLDKTSVTVEPNTRQAVGFTVDVPKPIKPGQYLAGIAAYVPDTTASDKQTDTKPAGPILKVHRRAVLAVEADVNGTWNPKLSISGVQLLTQLSGTRIGVQMRNDGDTFIKPSGTLVLQDGSGKQILSQPIAMHTFVTGTDVTYPINWPGALAPGSYPVAVELSYGNGQKATYSDTIVVSTERAAQAVPPPGTVPQLAGQAAQPGAGIAQMVQAALVGACIAAGCGLLGWYAYRRRAKRKPAEQA